ncbi:salicylic acid-binding protein 2-like [Actinidia eriantha]|uniref:salicylic acid-binding protein 2-like n=1 Tax=Actinidia eriantha TaxID=165200 RepID=UPI00258A0B5A|nr:salicylic acid-binding protein 2-like [Actinidia eriantha]
MEVTKKKLHFVGTHGMCQGAWIWYKVKPRVEAAGHRFTAVDLGACGRNPKTLDEIRTLYDYTLPLLEALASIPENEKVVLVGFSGGGFSAAVAMEKYPKKIALAIFLNATMPDTTHEASYVLDQYALGISGDTWKDTQFSTYGDPNEPLTSLLVGPKFMKSTTFQHCSIEDLTLATMLVRPGSLFMEDLKKAKKFTDEGFGSVKRVCVVCEQDLCLSAEFQRWMIENNPVEEVAAIDGADHMIMFSNPEKLCQVLLEMAQKHT